MCAEMCACRGPGQLTPARVSVQYRPCIWTAPDPLTHLVTGAEFEHARHARQTTVCQQSFTHLVGLVGKGLVSTAERVRRAPLNVHARVLGTAQTNTESVLVHGMGLDCC